MAKKRPRRQGESSGGIPRRKIPKAQTFATVQEVLLAELKTHGKGTIELVHNKCEFEKCAGHLIGIAVNALSKEKRIVRLDLQPTKRQQAHGRFVSLWRLNE
ncbi:MAG TPA: hypothetical protein PLY87_16750 [Planctomycetaceae bacterium]|nr:hypothetical protein [Planctomycetaceae bacterium]HQZ66745.1 hypothetical protein [Planctomycetaceae bacterium]